MDSWSYGTSVFLANETLLPSDSIPQNRKSITGFDDQRLSNDDVFADRSFADLACKSDNGFSAVSITKVAPSSSSCVVPLNLLHEELAQNQSSSSKLSRIDFKLRSFMDYGNSVNDDDTSSSRAFAIRAKKPRASSLCSQTPPLCQVYGCNMDLTSSKDYHRRHRVCETHSKTSVVIVSGIEQRFCQQCSRFHFLSEFDDGKRSCRRRLAGHNERRRKPSFYFLPGKQHKLLRTSQGVIRNKFSSSVDDFSLVLPEAYPGSRLYRASRLLSFNEEPTCSTTFPSSYSPEASGVSSVWDLHEAAAAPRSICALSLLSAQSQQQQQHFSETPNTVFSITQPNHQMEPSCIINHGNTKSVSSTVDLLQLSSHLQRIEQQRNFDDEVKQEYNELYFPGS